MCPAIARDVASVGAKAELRSAESVSTTAMTLSRVAEEIGLADAVVRR